MKKTFKQLTVGDNFYLVRDEQMTYAKQSISEIKHNEITYGYSDRCERPDMSNYQLKKPGNYGGYSWYFFFTTETDAIRFCKARLMKTLFKKIESAKSELENLRSFKAEHIELLNHEWTDATIRELEMQLLAA